MTQLPGQPSADRFAVLEHQIAQALLRHASRDDLDTRRVAVCGALVQRALRDGHTAISLRELLESWPLRDRGADRTSDEPLTDTDRPENEAALEAVLRTSQLVGDGQEAAGARRPLVLRSGLLAMHRNFALEQRLIGELDRRSRIRIEVKDPALAGRFRELFPDAQQGEPDGQAIAAAATLGSALTVVLGGPGTGKTTTVAKVLALLRPERLGLAAPTGKAAARLTESLRAQAAKILPDFDTDRLIAKTVHSLLQVDPRNGVFRRNRHRPLGHDLLVVDEASMLDTETFTALLEALPRDARLILLGDPDQLPSIGPGQVLRDLATILPTEPGPRTRSSFEGLTGTTLDPETSAAAGPALDDLTVRLTRTYRFDEGQPLGAFARAVRDGDPDRAIETLRSGAADLQWFDEPIGDGRRLMELVGAQVRTLASAESNDLAFEALPRQQVLAGLHDGPDGVRSLNRALDRLAEGHGLRQPRIVTVNDHALGVYNGDLGLCERGEDDVPIVEFRGADGSSRRIAAQRLPPNELAWAITIHKSQGSEFDEVVVVLPERDSELLTRELLYTAITRARTRVRLIATESILRRTIVRRTLRTTGLRTMLGEARSSASAGPADGASSSGSIIE